MDTFITTIYVICDDILKILNVEDDPQALMSNAEVMTFSIFAAKNFAGNHTKSRWFCKKLGYFSKILSNSCLNRRIHKIPWSIWNAVFRFLALVFTRGNDSKEFAVDSFPIACCQKSRIDRRHIFLGKQHIGFASSRRGFFCGIRVHMVVTANGEPVEAMFRPASEHDVEVLWSMELQLPHGSTLYADRGYTSYLLEDILSQDEGIQLLAKRKKNAKRKSTPEVSRLIGSRRQIVETAFSCITNLLPRYIKAITEKGFMIRVMSAVLAYSGSLVC